MTTGADGRTRGEVDTTWALDGVHMTALGDYAWRDAAGRWWPVPRGAVTDGASIPRLLWTLVGAPLTGQYRIAAFLHDVAYSTLGVGKDEADAMLREAAVYFGCSEDEADTLYLGVRRFGLGAYTEDQRVAAVALTTEPPSGA